MTTEQQSYAFQTEVHKLLKIITHSLYTNREIFLRELVSNASDALDKVRFLRSRGDEILNADLPLEISISMDKDKKELVISDTGVGMTRQELMDNLGTIARSGSEQFMADLAANAAKKDSGEDKDTSEDAASIIGRFGVGFYAVFMVAEKVEVTSRSYQGGEAYTWTSDGLGEFTITQADVSEGDLPRGTTIRAYLRDDAVDYLEQYRIESVLRTHSEFIPFPIKVAGEQVNNTPALWREPKFSITQEQYADFYKHLTFDSEAPLHTLHTSVDAPVQFTALAFIPSEGQEIYSLRQDKWGLDLYVRRVLIQRENKDLIPEYLSFLKGVVDTEDLPLNISRETLQENVVIRKIGQTLTKQALTELTRMSEGKPEEYETFWKAHGKVFKLGYSDFMNRDRFIPLLRFESSYEAPKNEAPIVEAENGDVIATPFTSSFTSLDAYVSRAREGQKEIWYSSAPNRDAARLDPRVEVFRRKGIEVLYLLEPIDEFLMENLGQHGDFTFKAVEHADAATLDAFDDIEAAAETKAAPLSETQTASFDDLVAAMKSILGDSVVDVRISHRLADSPAVLVQPDGAGTSSMDRLMRAMNQDNSMPHKIFELNRDHPILRSLLKTFEADRNDPVIPSTTQQLFTTTLLLDGYVQDTHALAQDIYKLMEQAGQWYTALHNK
ncbi:MAG: molecular chaperone HtpG [Pseudomonadota bacterium]